MEQELTDFLGKTNEVYGLYLDAIKGFSEWNQNLLKQQKVIERKTGKDASFFDSQPMLSFVEKEDGTLEQKSHWSTLGETKTRIGNKGDNYFKMANLCLVMIYSYWEYYRHKLGEKTGTTINSDLMGDIRLLRISIVHNKGVAKKDIHKCKIIKQFKTGDEIQIDEDLFEKIIELIRKEFKQ